MRRSQRAARRQSSSIVARGTALALLIVAAAPSSASPQSLLVPMDGRQSDHLRAYGLVYEAIAAGEPAEWLLNYRDGSFLLPRQRRIEQRAALLGVRVEPLSGHELAAIRSELAWSPA